MTLETDKQINKWIKQIKKNPDKKAANALVKVYYREMLGYVFNRSTDKDVAMDITQEIFVSMLQSIKNFDESRSTFRTWLYTIASRRLADYYRSSAYTKSLQETSDLTLLDREKFEPSIEKSVEINEIKAFVDTLDHDRREIFRLKVFEDCTFSKIAEITGLPESTVKTSFYATQKLIRKEFGKDG